MAVGPSGARLWWRAVCMKRNLLLHVLQLCPSPLLFPTILRDLGGYVPFTAGSDRCQVTLGFVLLCRVYWVISKRRLSRSWVAVLTVGFVTLAWNWPVASM